MKRVLYVEDDSINALVMKKLLQEFFDIMLVEDGEACLVCLPGNRFDLILMDINLGRGKMDGIQTLKEIRKGNSLPGIPVIAVTSYAMPEDEERFLKEGFDAYVAKPVDRLHLVDLIRKFVS